MFKCQFNQCIELAIELVWFKLPGALTQHPQKYFRAISVPFLSSIYENSLATYKRKSCLAKNSVACNSGMCSYFCLHNISNQF